MIYRMSIFKKKSLNIIFSEKEVIFSNIMSSINYRTHSNYCNNVCVFFKYIIGIVLLLILASFYEYLAHRFIMHNKGNFIGKAHVAHHKETNNDMSLKHTSKFLDKHDKKNRNLILSYKNCFHAFIFISITGLIIWKLLIGTNYFIPIILAFFIVSYQGIIWNSIHPQMHGEKPYNGENGFAGIIPRKYLGFFEKHHREHHKSKGTKNFNITIPIVDYLINFLF